MEVLAGKNIAELPPRSNPKQAYRVNHKAMQRWGLKESNLPADTVVMFKEPGIWDRHRSLVIAGIAAFGLQSAFAGVLMIQSSRRKRAETRLKESEERLTLTAASANVALWQFDRSTNQLWATEHCRALFGLASDAPLTRKSILQSIQSTTKRRSQRFAMSRKHRQNTHRPLKSGWSCRTPKSAGSRSRPAGIPTSTTLQSK